MIKKYIDKLFGRRTAITHKDARPVIYGTDKHAIAQARPSAAARGARARSCSARATPPSWSGGAVRDLLLGRTPKDFDIATSATPEEVRSVFRRSRIIGRRFQIVHVLCGAGDGRGLHLPRALHARGRRGQHRRARPHALRQRLRHPGRGRAAPRLHRQRAVLRPGEGRGLGLRPRPEGPEGEEAGDDRRPGHALPRGPGAHAARRAPGGEARASRSTPRRAAPITRAEAPAARTCRRRACSRRS